MFETKIDQLRTSSKSISYVRLDLLLIWTYLFSVIDLFLTYYVSSRLDWAKELNPFYHLGGWYWLLFVKILFPFIAYWLSVKIKSYYPLYVMLFLLVFVDLRNITLLLIHH